MNEATLTLFAGTINYQGDLKPNSFTFNHSNFTASFIYRKPLNRWLSWRLGAGMGQIEGADRYNRDYLKPRNLSFYTDLKEINTALELTMFDLAAWKFTPYVYGGIALYHFNPWTYDANGKKVFLKPLSTEGQGFTIKPYALTQIAIPFGAGVKYALNDCMNIGIEFSQRKTFTDYLDDVSSYFIDQNLLLQQRGPVAVQLAFRGDELPGGRSYPREGTIRGTPSEMDWYYFLGATFEMKFSCFKNMSSHKGKKHLAYNPNRCPSAK